MKKCILTTAAFDFALLGSFGLTTSPANAGPICLTDNDSPNTYRSCQFYSYAECRASSRGAGSSCIANPRGTNDGSYGYVVGPSPEFGNAYNRYDSPVDGGGYVRPYRW